MTRSDATHQSLEHFDLPFRLEATEAQQPIVDQATRMASFIVEAAVRTLNGERLGYPLPKKAQQNRPPTEVAPGSLKQQAQAQRERAFYAALAVGPLEINVVLAHEGSIRDLNDPRLHGPALFMTGRRHQYRLYVGPMGPGGQELLLGFTPYDKASRGTGPLHAMVFRRPDAAKAYEFVGTYEDDSDHVLGFNEACDPDDLNRSSQLDAAILTAAATPLGRVLNREALPRLAARRPVALVGVSRPFDPC